MSGIFFVNIPQKETAPNRVLFLFGRATHASDTALCALAHRIRFANSEKGRSVLARELLDEFSSQSEPSGWRLQKIPKAFAFGIFYPSRRRRLGM